ncbi:MAG: hypothetical protein ACYDDA_07995 [Acidiferrobacteraceae bacterium]
MLLSLNAAPDSAYLLILAVFLVGVLHTMVPDHWLPIAVMGRQQGWSRLQTARAAFIAGTGHVLSTLLIGIAFWGVGTIFAHTLGHYLNVLTSFALLAFGAWIVWSSRTEMGHDRAHHHAHPHAVTHSHTHRYPHVHHHVGEKKKKNARMALLLILGSSPMLEGIPAFLAAAPFGVGLIVVMSIVFALSTILTYVILCVYSTALLQSTRLGAVERYGEVLSGFVIMAVGLIFWAFPVLSS